MKISLSISSALAAVLAASALFVAGCSTVSSRIKENPAAFQSLSPSDQALIQQGRIRGGMSQEAVYLAWGRPDQKASGMMHNTATETWVYLITRTLPPYYYGWGGFYGGYAGNLVYYGRHGHHIFYGAYYAPFYDPFYYPFNETITQPQKTVSFQHGKVVAFQYLAPAY